MENLIIKDDEIDLGALFRTIWNGRKTVYYSIGFCALVGLIVAIVSPVKYTASATLLPSSEDNTASMGGLSSLAGLAGINIGSMLGNNTNISPELYPQVIQSVPYLIDLMHVKLVWEDYPDSLSIYEKSKIDNEAGIGNVIYNYTLGLPWTIKNTILPCKKEVDFTSLGISSDFYNLSEADYRLLKSLRRIVSLEVDNKTGLVTLAVTMEEPLQTAQLAVAATKLLQKHVVDYKIQKAVDNLNFIQGRYNEAKLVYENTQQDFFEYKDLNRNIVSERVDPQYQHLSDAFDITSSVYKGLSQQLEQAKIAVKQATPVFKILEPVVVPIERSAPRRSLILIICCFLGSIFGVAIVLSNSIIKIRIFDFLK